MRGVVTPIDGDYQANPRSSDFCLLNAELCLPLNLLASNGMTSTTSARRASGEPLPKQPDATCDIHEMIYVRDVAAWAGGEQPHLTAETRNVMGELYCAWLARRGIQTNSSPSKLQEYRRNIAKDLAKPGGAIELLKYMKMSNCWPRV